MLGRRGPLSKLVGGSIGLAKEYQADRESRKAQGSGAEPAQSQQDHDHDDHDIDQEEDDDEAWAQELDAAQLETTATQESSESDFDEGTWIENFIKNHPPPPYERQQPDGVLSMPVIIPERRPGFKTRGFVRAYAPVLQDAGIDQDTWLEFLNGFDKSISGHKWFHVVNVAVWVAGKVRLAVEGVSIIARFVTMAIHLSIEAGRRSYMNNQQNKFLDHMNDEFFKPRGLYCMIIKYDPKSDEPEETIDVTTNTIAQVAKRDDEDRAKWKNLYQGSAGKVERDEEIPDFAPLVFPELDKLDDQQKENAVKHFGHFLAEYYDRKGQAKFDAENEGTKLAGVTGEKEFASRYSDPNHPASQGGLVSTFSGGKVQYTGPLQKLTQRRNDRRSRLGITRQVGPEARKQRRDMRPMRKFLKQDVLYLMVVNLPTKEEQEIVLAELERAKQEGKGQEEFNLRKTLGLQGLGRK